MPVLSNPVLTLRLIDQGDSDGNTPVTGTTVKGAALTNAEGDHSRTALRNYILDLNDSASHKDLNETISGTKTFTGTVSFATSIGNFRSSGIDDNHDTNAIPNPLTIAANGDVTLLEDLSLGDNRFLNLGIGTDLRLYHDAGSGNSYIEEAGSGKLVLKASSFSFRDTADGEDIILANENAAVELYHDGSKKLETTATGATVTGVIVATSLTGNVNGNLTGAVTGAVTGNADSASAALVTAIETDGNHRLVFTAQNSSTEAAGLLYKDAGGNLLYNPTSNTLTVGGAITTTTLNGNVVGNVTGDVTGYATGALITATSSNASYRMVFTEQHDATDSNGLLYKDSAANFFYNPGSDTLTVSNVTATVNGDVNGNVTGATSARAWAKINNAGGIYDSFNVSSNSDLGTGQARVNFTTSIPSNSAAVSDCDPNADSTRLTRSYIPSGAPTTAHVDVYGHTGSGPLAHYAMAYRDANYIHVIVFGV